MSGPARDEAFAGSIPKTYERYLVPLIFDPYAADLAHRLAARSPTRVLEIAAGTGDLAPRASWTFEPRFALGTTTPCSGATATCLGDGEYCGLSASARHRSHRDARRDARRAAG